MLNETNQLFHYILHSGNVLPTLDHRRLLELVEGLDWPEPGNPPPSTYYDLKGYRSQMLIEPEHGEIFDQIHKAHIRLMPSIYEHNGNTLPIIFQRSTIISCVNLRKFFTNLPNQ